MASTALVTFMVRAPPDARTVSLYGSWDNFATSYPMKRDKRIADNHWSSTPVFTNITCDGRGLSGVARNGALRMGGTYWYFYKLDDDIEFHNSAEQSTTQCPMLPGQLMNILNMPVALSGNRSRNTSISSTSSEQYTMNPTDKFINPRPVPGKPQLARLRTSPTLLQEGWSAKINTPASSQTGRSTTSGPGSQPSSASTLRSRRLQRKASLNVGSRSRSPSIPLSSGLRSAFRTLRTPRSRSPDANRSIAQEVSLAQSLSGQPRSLDSSNPASTSSSRDQSPNQSRQGRSGSDLAFRRPLVDTESPIDSNSAASFQQHRRQRSTSREPSSLRNSLSLETQSPVISVDTSFRQARPLDTLTEVLSAQNTPAFPLTATKQSDRGGESPNLEKRLPTLPNSPSSAYPPSSVEDTSPNRRWSLDVEQLQSHFSATTIDTSATPCSMRFPSWSTHVPVRSPESPYAASIFDEAPMSAVLSDHILTPKHLRDMPLDSDVDTVMPEMREVSHKTGLNLATTFSASTINSSVSSSLSVTPSEIAQKTAVWPLLPIKTPSDSPKYQHYRLPSEEYSSEATLKRPALPARTDSLNHASPVVSTTRPEPPHTTTMQQLIDELSYLGNMIHHS